MHRTFLALVTLLIVFGSCSERNYTSSSKYLETLNQEITGELAYETTAYVEKYWRIVGNTGFNKSIFWIANHLEEAGYINEDDASDSDVLTYRIERRALKRPTWESIDATVSIIGE